MVPRLIPDFTSMDETTLTDFWTLVAHNIEDSFLQVGMTPKEDYTALDLFKLAQPFVLNTWEGAKLTVVLPR